MLQKDKIAHSKVKEQILAEVSKAFDKHGEFQTTGLCCYGYHFDFQMNLTLVTRNQKTLEVKSEGIEPVCGQTWQENGATVMCSLEPNHEGDHGKKEIIVDPVLTEVKVKASGKKGKAAKNASN